MGNWRIDWRDAGYKAGLLSNPNSPIAIDRQIFIAALATACGLVTSMPRGSYRMFADGYLAGQAEREAQAGK